MLRFSSDQFRALSEKSEAQFVERVRKFLESDFPEIAGFDEDEARHNARILIKQAKNFGLTSQTAVLRYASMLLGYFVHEPRAYDWARELLSAKDIAEEQKLLGLEHRLYGTPLWA